MSATISEAIDRAQELLATTRNAAMATVNADGSPHNTPFWLLQAKTIEHFYWISHKDAQHSQNVERDGKLFVVIYENGKGGGLYISADNARVLADGELEEALLLLNQQRAEQNKTPKYAADYAANSSHRIYRADSKTLYVNVGDFRQEISFADLAS